jgi:hypothetical protein
MRNDSGQNARNHGFTEPWLRSDAVTTIAHSV